MPDSSKNTTFILKSSANYSVFDSGSSNSGLIHQIYDSASTTLRLQSLSNRLDDKSSQDPASLKFDMVRLQFVTSFTNFPQVFKVGKGGGGEWD